MEIFKLVDGYSRNKTKPSKDYRFMTIAEVKKLNPGDSVPFISNNGTAKICKVNGKPKTCKRSPHKVHIPVKYGLYEYYTIEHEGNSDQEYFPRLLVEIQSSG